MPRLDTPLKTNGGAVYGIDVRVPDMVYAAVEASPVPGGRLVSFDFDAVKDRPGVITAYRLGEGGIGKLHFNLDEVANRASGLHSAVAVVADTYYRALTALQLMPKEWDAGEHGDVSDEGIIAGALEVLGNPDDPTYNPAVSEGDARGVIGASADKVEATYVTPYLDHACMEPLNCTAHVTADRADVWTGTQNPPVAHAAAVEETGPSRPSRCIFTTPSSAPGSGGACVPTRCARRRPSRPPSAGRSRWCGPGRRTSARASFAPTRSITSRRRSTPTRSPRRTGTGWSPTPSSTT